MTLNIVPTDWCGACPKAVVARFYAERATELDVLLFWLACEFGGISEGNFSPGPDDTVCALSRSAQQFPSLFRQ